MKIDWWYITFWFNTNYLFVWCWIFKPEKSNVTLRYLQDSMFIILLSGGTTRFELPLTSSSSAETLLTAMVSNLATDLLPPPPRHKRENGRLERKSSLGPFYHPSSCYPLLKSFLHPSNSRFMWSFVTETMEHNKKLMHFKIHLKVHQGLCQLSVL